MSDSRTMLSLRIVIVACIFSSGYLAGSLGQGRAEAQLGGVAKDALGQAAATQGGTVGSVAQMGTSLTEMEQNISALQKNVDTLKKVKAALGG